MEYCKVCTYKGVWKLFDTTSILTLNKHDIRDEKYIECLKNNLYKKYIKNREKLHYYLYIDDNINYEIRRYESGETSYAWRGYGDYLTQYQRSNNGQIKRYQNIINKILITNPEFAY